MKLTDRLIKATSGIDADSSHPTAREATLRSQKEQTEGGVDSYKFIDNITIHQQDYQDWKP